MGRSIFHTLVSLVLAFDYFFFQIEAWEEEYETTHPTHSDEVSFTVPSLNWESFDKSNAPPAFVVDAGLRTELFFKLSSPARIEFPAKEPYKLIKDKSPPLL